jgi:hypothetical protein
MAIYKKFLHAKKGMSTVFGALFFVILAIMSLNVSLWYFLQYDNYNRTDRLMSQTDTLAASENLVPNNPGARDFGANSFNITVNNLGIALRIARIYIVNISPIISNQCLANPCVVDPSPSNPPVFVNGNVGPGLLDYRIKVNTGGGLSPINDGNTYSVVLVSTRGRSFSFFYPWPSATSGGGGTFVTNIGPLSIYFDFQSFNFTQGTQTQSQPAWCVPTGTNLVFWVKIANSATDSSVTLKKNTVFFPTWQYSTSGNQGEQGPFYLVDKATANPSNVIAYSEAGNPYVLPAATANGPSGFIILKFAAKTAAGAAPNFITKDDFWLSFMGFSYLYRGQIQGQTIPFVALRSANGYPGTC